MKTFIYSVFFTALLLFTFTNCNNEDEQEKTLRQTYIDISDFTMYKGSPNGGKKVQFNNLKKRQLVEQYLSEVFSPDSYKNITIRFNGDKLTYLTSASGGGGIQTISDYKISHDSLFIMISDTITNTKSPKFIALIDGNNNFYRRSGLIGYTNRNFSPEETTEPAEPRVKQEALTTMVDMQTVLEKLVYSNINELTNPADTIVWCNVIYPFN